MSKPFRIDCSVTQKYILSPWLLRGWGNERSENEGEEKWNEIFIGREEMEFNWPFVCRLPSFMR